MSHLSIVTDQDGPMTITGIHPYADKFPMLPEGELKELAESIRANGLRQPIVITPDGLILDGRNRAKACELAEVDPSTVVYDGEDLAEYVIDSNTARRHMSTGARAMATALVLAADKRRENGRWKRGSVLGGDVTESRNTWKDALRQSGTILDYAPDVAEAVVNGGLALDAAFKLAEDRRDAERRKLEREEQLAAEEADARTFVEEHDPALAARVDGEDLLSFVEAKDLWDRRNHEEAARIAREKADEEKAKRDHAKAMTDLYSSMARGLQVCSGYGGYSDITELMAEFSTKYLHPPQFEREFDIENLKLVRKFADMLIEWKESGNG